MIARYYSELLCYFECTTDELNKWLDKCTDVGDTLGEPHLFDVDFSANLAKFEIGIHAAHAMPDPDSISNDPAGGLLYEAFKATTHAAVMFEHIGAIERLRMTQLTLSQGVGDDERLLMNTMTVWQPQSPVTQAT